MATQIIKGENKKVKIEDEKEDHDEDLKESQLQPSQTLPATHERTSSIVFMKNDIKSQSENIIPIKPMSSAFTKVDDDKVFSSFEGTSNI